MGSIETKRASDVLGANITQVTKQPIHIGGILLCFRLYNNITIAVALIQIDAEIFTLYKLYRPYRMIRIERSQS